MFNSTQKFALGLVIIAMIAAGCDSHKFDNAPTAHAPAKTGQTAPPTEQGPPQMGNQLPPNHPPVVANGQMGAGPMGAGQMGANKMGNLKKVPMPTAGPQGMSPDQFGKVGPLRWSAPQGWMAVKPASRMRLAEYHLPAPQGGEPATVTAFYFGPNGGGSIQANIDRWVGQFKDAQGKPAQTTRTVNGMKVHLVAVTGTYTAGAAMGGGQAQTNWRMRGAIVESPAGNYFFKMTGPAKTVAAHDKGFDALVASFKPAAAAKK